MADADFTTILDTLPQVIQTHITSLQSNSLPITANLTTPIRFPPLPTTGLGTSKTWTHLSSIVPSLAQGHAGARYYGTFLFTSFYRTGFVTGGVTPAALLADYIVSTYDQNVQVHLPQSISTSIERHTIQMLCDLLSLEGFNGTLTTGATAGNIMGIACGRESVIFHLHGVKVSETGNGNVNVLVAGGHSSISKACSILGVGRQNSIDVTSEDFLASFDISRLEQHLYANEKSGIGSIVVATFGEVNTGAFTRDIATIYSLCQQYKAWLHIDAAFGILARIHPQKHELSRGLELADSISFDGHKFFNVPYDCGVFLTKDMETLSTVCGNTGAAYLSSSTEEVSPLNVSLENSRRFRALPLYASLLSLGKHGYIDIVKRCCAFAEAMGKQIRNSEKFRLLQEVEFNIVLFQAKGFEDFEANDRIKDLINQTAKLYVSGTNWKGQGALRIAVCNHLTSASATESSEILTTLENLIS
jgi:glutamate/tyrosine decarboxylase-like PLP-dependent enzyme